MKNIFNTIFIVLGVLLVISGLQPSNTDPVTSINTGLITIIGALAFKSAKLRKLKEVSDTKFRMGFELAGILVIILMIYLQNDLLHLIATDPVPNLLIPLIAVTAYFYISLK